MCSIRFACRFKVTKISWPPYLYNDLFVAENSCELIAKWQCHIFAVYWIPEELDSKENSKNQILFSTVLHKNSARKCILQAAKNIKIKDHLKKTLYVICGTKTKQNKNNVRKWRFCGRLQVFLFWANIIQTAINSILYTYYEVAWRSLYDNVFNNNSVYLGENWRHGLFSLVFWE